MARRTALTAALLIAVFASLLWGLDRAVAADHQNQALRAALRQRDLIARLSRDLAQVSARADAVSVVRRLDRAITIDELPDGSLQVDSVRIHFSRGRAWFEVVAP